MLAETGMSPAFQPSDHLPDTVPASAIFYSSNVKQPIIKITRNSYRDIQAKKNTFNVLDHHNQIE